MALTARDKDRSSALLGAPRQTGRVRPRRVGTLYGRPTRDSVISDYRSRGAKSEGLQAKKQPSTRTATSSTPGDIFYANAGDAMIVRHSQATRWPWPYRARTSPGPNPVLARPRDNACRPSAHPRRSQAYRPISDIAENTFQMMAYCKDTDQASGASQHRCVRRCLAPAKEKTGRAT